MFLLSGAAALMYQMVWARKLELVFGVTLYATSAVVSAFMAGLALGSLFFGRLVDRWKKPLVLFALLEAGIALFAFAFPAILIALRWIYVGFYGPFGDNYMVMSLVRFALAFLVLIVPTSLMGGTLPVITRACAGTGQGLGRKVATLYSLNNLGAFLGCMTAGYVLLELLGPTGTMRSAAFLNLVVVMMALRLSPASAAQLPSPGGAPESERSPGPTRVRLSMPVKVALWVFALEGVTSLVYQMAWVRTLIFFVFTSVYSFTVIVGTFLVGLALGSFVCRRWVDRLRNPYFALGAIEMGVGLTALVTIPLLPFLLGIDSGLQSLMPSGFPSRLGTTAANFAITFLVILAPTACMGATLPVVSRIYVSEVRGLGRKMGVLGCLDTIGSVFGAFAGGFILIPLLGASRTIVITALVNLALAAWVFAIDPIAPQRWTLRKPLHIALASAAVLVLFAVRTPTPVVEHSSILKGQPMLKLVDYREDQVASVSVVEKAGFGRFLYVNDEAVGSTGCHDRLSHEIEIHQALLLHPNPERLLLIGMGLGLGVRVALTHDVQVDAVELSPSVVAVNSAFSDSFQDYSSAHGGRGPLSDPRVTVRVEDGRNYVLGTSRTYDVIHVGGFHPLRSSSAAGFYTVDFFEQCKRILRPEGHLALWLPTHGVPHADFRMILRTFLAAFPHATVWHKHTPECCLLVGKLTPLAIDFERYERSFGTPAVLEHLARCQVQEVYDVLDSFCIGPDTLASAVGEGRLHSDAHPYIEYHWGRAQPTDRPRNLALLADHRERVRGYLVNVPGERREHVEARLDTWHQASQKLLAIQSLEFLAPPDVTAAAYEQAMGLNPDDRNIRFLYRRWSAWLQQGLARQATRSGQQQKALRHLRQALEACPESEFGAEARFELEAVGTGLSPSAE